MVYCLVNIHQSLLKPPLTLFFCRKFFVREYTQHLSFRTKTRFVCCNLIFAKLDKRQTEKIQVQTNVHILLHGIVIFRTHIADSNIFFENFFKNLFQFSVSFGVKSIENSTLSFPPPFALQICFEPLITSEFWSTKLVPGKFLLVNKTSAVFILISAMIGEK